MFIAFPEFRPDVNDWNGQHTQVLEGVLPRGDGYGPFPNLQAYTAALPAACRGAFCARNPSDGSIVIFAATSNRLFTLNNTTLGWTPVSKVTALTSISNASPAVFTKTSHGLVANDALVLSTTGALPTGLTVGTVYYVRSGGLTADEFTVSTTPGGAAVNTSSAGSGTHSMTYFYSSIPTTDQWQFVQYGSIVVAVQANSAPQAFTIGSSTAFADLSGSPPTSRYVAVVARQLVLTGQTSQPRRVSWSALDDITTYTPGTNFANQVDLPDGGITRGVAGGEFGLVFQEGVIRSMVYVPGAAVSFQIERITEDEGLYAPYSIVRAGGRVAFISQKGFQEYIPGAGLNPIGKERVDRTILDDIDGTKLLLCIGSADPASTKYYWGYKSAGSSNTAAFDKVIAYDYALKRWSPPVEISGEYLSTMIKPGITLDALDSVSSSIDALEPLLDSIEAALTSRLSAITTDHEIGFFDGANVEAVLETPEQGGSGRIFIRGIEVRTDADEVYTSIRYRSNPQASLSATSESAINGQGVCPQRIDAKLARAKVRIPAGELWTYCMGVTPEFRETGRR